MGEVTVGSFAWILFRYTAWHLVFHVPRTQVAIVFGIIRRLAGRLLSKMFNDTYRTYLAPLDPLLPITSSSLISVIIPTYNEEGNIRDAVASAMEGDGNVEVIVADGGSKDNTLQMATDMGVQHIVQVTPSGKSGRVTRSDCLNRGAKEAKGEVLLFLHADTRLPSDYGKAIRSFLPLHNDKEVILGAFSFRLFPRIHLVEWGTAIRSKYFKLPYGDQALFTRSDVFCRLKGFPSQPIMEDLDLVLTVHDKGGMVVTLPEAITTSSRRWAIKGVWANTMLNQVMLWGRCVGVPLETLAQCYYGNDRGIKDY